jgi:hypothetical protein
VVVAPIERDHSGHDGVGQDAAWGSFFYKMALVQVASILSGLVLGPLVLLAALVVVLRRHGAHSGSLFRVEVVNAQGHGSYSGTVAVPPPGGLTAGLEAALPPATAANEEQTAQAFDLGPSYEEEKRAKEEAQRQQEEALLRHIFDENVQLREQIDGQADAA